MIDFTSFTKINKLRQWYSKNTANSAARDTVINSKTYFFTSASFPNRCVYYNQTSITRVLTQNSPKFLVIFRVSTKCDIWTWWRESDDAWMQHAQLPYVACPSHWLILSIGCVYWVIFVDTFRLLSNASIGTLGKITSILFER